MHRRSKGGFSLVEVAMALGVMATALIGIMGLLSVGSKSFHGAITTTTNAAIFQQVMNDLKQTDFTTLTTQGNPPARYFDDQGDDITSDTSIPKVYDVAVFVTPTTTLPSAPAANSNLASIQVYISYHPGPRVPKITAPLSSNSPLPANTALYTALVANTDSTLSNKQ